MPKSPKKKKKSPNKFVLKFKKNLERRRAFFKKHPFLRILTFICSIIIVLYLVVFFSAKYIEAAVTFPGMFVNTLEYTQDKISQTTLNFEDINIEFDGENINGLYIDNDSDKTIYYLHGNGGELVLFYETIQKIRDLGYNVLALDYPGYGKSTGIPYEEDLQEYVDTFYDYAQKTYEIIPETTIIWGYSVGSGIALDFVQRTQKNFFKIILEAPYTSRYDLSEEIYGMVIQKLFFLKNSFVSTENILTNDIPLLIIHGEQDAVVPFYMGEELYDVSNKDITSFISVPDGDHYNLLNTELVLKKIQDFLSPKIIGSFYDRIDKEDFDVFIFQKYLEDLDISSDISFTKYVDPDIPFTQLSYIPEDLVYLDTTYITDTKGNAQMRQEPADKLAEMAEKFYEDMGEKMVAVSTYRSYAYQAGIKARGCPDNLCAKAGHSEHQSGLAVDFWSASTQAYWNSSQRLTSFYTWLTENAHEYGFHNTYQNGLEIDGYEIEPWHWRYVGVKFATYLWQQDITFAEFYYGQNKG